MINEDARTGVGEMLKAEELGYIPPLTMLTCSSIFICFAEYREMFVVLKIYICQHLSGNACFGTH
jgi:hypothetical protein